VNPYRQELCNIPPIIARFKRLESLICEMSQEMIQIPKKEYEAMLEEIGILRNKDMMDAIKETEEAKKKGVKSWELKTRP
jgi:hypothetical protein